MCWRLNWCVPKARLAYLLLPGRARRACHPIHLPGRRQPCTSRERGLCLCFAPIQDHYTRLSLLVAFQRHGHRRIVCNVSKGSAGDWFGARGWWWWLESFTKLFLYEKYEATNWKLPRLGKFLIPCYLMAQCSKQDTYTTLKDTQRKRCNNLRRIFIFILQQDKGMHYGLKVVHECLCLRLENSAVTYGVGGCN